jgi:hypothetical protein
VAHDQGIDGPEADLRGELLEGILRSETGVCLRLPSGKQGLGQNRRGLLGPGLAAVQDLPDSNTGFVWKLGETPHVLAALLAQGAVGVDVLRDRQTVLGQVDAHTRFRLWFRWRTGGFRRGGRCRTGSSPSGPRWCPAVARRMIFSGFCRAGFASTQAAYEAAFDIYQVPGVSETVNMDHTKLLYYGSHRGINPTGIVPKGPELDFSVFEPVAFTAEKTGTAYLCGCKRTANRPFHDGTHNAL